MPEMDESGDLISVIITVLNGGKWIDDCMESIIKQTAVQTPRQQEVQQEPHYRDQQQLQLSTAQKSIKSANIDFYSQSPTTSSPSSSSPSTESIDAKISDFQNTTMPLVEVCVFDDCSTDNTLHILKKWKTIFRLNSNVVMHIVQNKTGNSKGVGYGRNKAIAASKGNYFCFQDIDDKMLPDRILKQYHMAKQFKNAIIGTKFIREPSDSTFRFTQWANRLHSDQLNLQIYTSNGPTVIMPTWLFHRQVYDNVTGGFSEEGRGCPEDLIFFYKHLDNKGLIKRVDECLLTYRYHKEATTFSVQENTILDIRLKHLIENVLNKPPWCNGFSIWNAGKQGKRFFRSLPVELKKKVIMFCDVDRKKINKNYNHYDADLRESRFSIPITHFTKVQPPVVICMKLDMTKGVFENNLNSLNFTEGDDYILFT